MRRKEIFPVLNWLRAYRKKWFAGDIAAGITVGVMLIPQGMAYAMIAGVPPIYGLYASTFPLIVYALFGTSRQLAVGPVAIDSLLVLASVSAFAQVGSTYFVELAILLAFVEGIVLVLFSFLRLGFLVNFLSRPVLGGFTAAAAVVIGISQLRHLLGIGLKSTGNVFQTLFSSLQEFTNWSLLSFGMGLTGIALILLLKKINKRIPGALAAVVLSILAVYLLDLDESGIQIVGEIPAGLPSFSWPNFDLDVIQKLLPAAFTVALIAFTEAISVAKAIQAKHRDYEILPNQELFAIGLANIVGSFFQSFSVTGGLGRTAVNDQSGANTGLASLFSAAVVLLTLLFLTPLFYYLPHPILASIIMVAVSGLIDVKYSQDLWNKDKREFVTFILTFMATLVFGIVNGILIGVFLSLGMVVFRMSKPHIVQLGRVANTHSYGNLFRLSDAKTYDDLLIVRFEAVLFFANCEYFRERVLNWASQKPELKKVLIDAQPLNEIDSTAMDMLFDLIEHLNGNRVDVVFGAVNDPVRDKFRKSKLIDTLGANRFYVDVHEAVTHHLNEVELRSTQRVTRN